MRALITGASSGVGRAAARLFAEGGGQVALLARSADALKELAAELAPGALALPTDVRSPDEVADAVATAFDQFGGIDVVINAAGVGFPTPLDTLEPEVWSEVIDTNLSGTFFVAREAGLRMLDGDGGAIVNVGSELSSIGMGLCTAYCASKFGVVGLTKALAAEFAPRVRVNIVCPGPIDTPMMDAELEWYADEFDSFADPKATRQAALDRVPLKRFAQAEEVAKAIRFLSVDAPYATGAVLPLDGGTTIA